MVAAARARDARAPPYRVASNTSLAASAKRTHADVPLVRTAGGQRDALVGLHVDVPPRRSRQERRPQRASCPRRS